MIDIVIPYKTSAWHDNELKYSLRSLEKFGRNVGNVFVVGDCPEFLKESIVKVRIENERPFIESFSDGVFHIPATDKYGHERNIMEKLLIACKDPRVSENFIAWQDDYFLTAETDLENYPYYYSGTIQEKIAQRIPNDGYRRSMENTLNHLNIYGANNLFFDIHCPVIYNKGAFGAIMKFADWNIGNGFVIKSLYINKAQYISEKILIEMPDLKFTNATGLSEIKEKTKDRHIFSICDQPAKAMRIFLEECYTEKSKYEK